MHIVLFYSLSNIRLSIVISCYFLFCLSNFYEIVINVLEFSNKKSLNLNSTNFVDLICVQQVYTLSLIDFVFYKI
jgi:hypothetical protein